MWRKDVLRYKSPGFLFQLNFFISRMMLSWNGIEDDKIWGWNSYNSTTMFLDLLLLFVSVVCK